MYLTEALIRPAELDTLCEHLNTYRYVRVRCWPDNRVWHDKVIGRFHGRSKLVMSTVTTMEVQVT